MFYFIVLYRPRQVKMASLNDEVLAEAEGEMLYWDEIYRRYTTVFYTWQGGCQNTDSGCLAFGKTHIFFMEATYPLLGFLSDIPIPLLLPQSRGVGRSRSHLLKAMLGREQR